MSYIIEFENISKSFPGVKALSDISFGVKEGTVHAIVGENGAGKSTLMNILDGQFSQDSGRILVRGKEVKINSPQDAADFGISMIHQELSVIPYMTVADNIFLNNEILGRMKLVKRKKIIEAAQKILDDADLDINASTEMRNLTISQQQLVEIEKVLSRNAKIIIMDEPTSSISEHEADILLSRINKLKREGITIIYISHRLEELKKVADYITIIRDGQLIDTCKAEDISHDMIIEKMVGRKLDNIYPEHRSKLGDIVFEVEGISGEKFTDVSFSVRKGEILGVAGLVGAGRTEMARAIFGLDELWSGKISVNGKPYSAKHPRDAVRQGVVLLPEDRRNEGLVLCRCIRENISLSSLSRIARKLLMSRKVENEITADLYDKLQVKASGLETEVATLSGGNQQKVVIAKWLMTEPTVMIVDEPTRGIDVGAKYEIYSLLCQLAAEEKAVVMISSDLPELLGICDRIIVMCNGRVTGCVNREEANQELIMQYATTFSS